MCDLDRLLITHYVKILSALIEREYRQCDSALDELLALGSEMRFQIRDGLQALPKKGDKGKNDTKRRKKTRTSRFVAPHASIPKSSLVEEAKMEAKHKKIKSERKQKKSSRREILPVHDTRPDTHTGPDIKEDTAAPILPQENMVLVSANRLNLDQNVASSMLQAELYPAVVPKARKAEESLLSSTSEPTSIPTQVPLDKSILPYVADTPVIMDLHRPDVLPPGALRKSDAGMLAGTPTRPAASTKGIFYYSLFSTMAIS